MTTVHKRTLVVDGITPVSAYGSLRKRAQGGSFLLESVIPGERWGRYSILGYRPKRQIVVYAESGRDPFEELARQIPTGQATPSDVAERFASAFVGVVNYDIVHTATKVEPWPNGGGKLPIARLVADATIIVFDHLTHTATLVASDAMALDEAAADLARLAPLAPMEPPDPMALPDDISVTMSDAEFEQGVERIKEYIRAGDAFKSSMPVRSRPP
jgi:anthranilate synthase component I